MNANGASIDAYRASAKAHSVKNSSDVTSMKASDPAKWKAEDHHEAADAHEEAAVRHEHAAKNSHGHAYYTREHHELQASGHSMRATEHRKKAEVADHFQSKRYGKAHDAAKELHELPHGNKASAERTLALTAKKTSKVPHNEAVARDAEEEERHDDAAKLRRLRKSETPNVRRLA